MSTARTKHGRSALHYTQRFSAAGRKAGTTLLRPCP